MNKKMVKTLSTIIMTIMLISMACTVFALEPGEIVAGDVDVGGIQTVGGKIVGVLQAVGVVLSVVVLIVIGLKYMMGSAEEKAEYKKTLMPYFIGAALIFTASAFAQVIFKFFSGWTL